jgi:hypothetical protein
MTQEYRESRYQKLIENYDKDEPLLFYAAELADIGFIRYLVQLEHSIYTKLEGRLRWLDYASSVCPDYAKAFYDNRDFILDIRVDLPFLICNAIERDDPMSLTVFMKFMDMDRDYGIPYVLDALRIAIKSDKVDMIKILLMPYKIYEHIDKTPVLEIILRENCKELVPDIIEFFEGRQPPDNLLERLLYDAIENELPVLAELLLKNGANPHFVDPNGYNIPELVAKSDNSYIRDFIARDVDGKTVKIDE